MNAFEGYLLKQRLVGTLSEEMSKLAARTEKQKRRTRVHHARAAKNPSKKITAFLAREATRTTRRDQAKAVDAAEAGFKGMGSEAADSAMKNIDSAMKMGKGGKAALLAAILAAGGTTAAVGAKAYKRSRPTPKASAKQKLVAMIKRNPKKSMVAGGGAAAATLAALAANK